MTMRNIVNVRCVLVAILLSVQMSNGYVAVIIGSSRPTTTIATRTTTSTTTTTSTELNLFGGGNKDKSPAPGGGGGPNMMDQLAMFKKAQEIATKKKKLDEELTKETFIGTSSGTTATAADVTVKIKYVPVQNPMDPNPEYECIDFIFDDEYYTNASTSTLEQDIQNAILNGIEMTNRMVAEKYKILEADLREALGGAMPGLK